MHIPDFALSVTFFLSGNHLSVRSIFPSEHCGYMQFRIVFGGTLHNAVLAQAGKSIITYSNNTGNEKDAPENAAGSTQTSTSTTDRMNTALLNVTFSGG